MKTLVERLLPCPFCGHAPALQYDDDRRWRQVVCGGCGAKAAEHPANDGPAIAAWNRRAATALTSPETGGVPEGWKLVPIEPTPEMIRAYRGALKKHIDALPPEVRTSGARGHIIRDDTIKATARYAAMLAAAPAPEGA